MGFKNVEFYFGGGGVLVSLDWDLGRFFVFSLDVEFRVRVIFLCGSL